MKNAFYFILKALLVFKTFNFLSWLFGCVEKRLDQKDKINFKIYDVTTWLANNYKTHIDQYRMRCSGNEIWSVNRYNMRNIFLENIHKIWWRNQN